MLNNEAQAATPIKLLDPQNAANTAAATGGWVDVRQYEGDIAVIQQVGALTGSIAGVVQDATDGSGTGAANVTGAAFTSVAAANNIQEIAVSASAVRGWIRYLGTVTTGPVQVSVSALARPKVV